MASIGALVCVDVGLQCGATKCLTRLCKRHGIPAQWLTQTASCLAEQHRPASQINFNLIIPSVYRVEQTPWWLLLALFLTVTAPSALLFDKEKNSSVVELLTAQPAFIGGKRKLWCLSKCHNSGVCSTNCGKS